VKIVCDQHIPFLVEAVQSGWPEVEICPMKPEEIDASAVRDADVLVVRTRTRVDAALLTGSRVQLVCTATIGFDHLDTAWLNAQGIRWTACPGCNAQAVCDYIEEVLCETMDNGQWTMDNSPLTIGVVGVGHVGSLVARMAERRGLHVLLNDPPRGIGKSLDEIAETCDIITFHVPLTKSRQPSAISDQAYPTYHLCNEAFLSKTKPHALIINAARGGVVDEEALLRSGRPFVLDTWEGEPQLNPSVLAAAQRASMHIAGYSLEGKLNATRICLDEIEETFHLSPSTFNIQHSTFTRGDSAPGWLERITKQLQANPQLFECLRKQYVLR
jgi:erythronate-4-phosphate dehydrogenase